MKHFNQNIWALALLCLFIFCQAKATTDSELPAFTVAGTITEITCLGSSNGAIDISITGGTGPFTYSWSNGETTEDISGLPPGDYTVTVTDTNDNSTETETFTIDPGFDIFAGSNDQSAPPECTYDDTGKLRITVNAGTGPYDYRWEDTEGNVVATTRTIDGVVGGTYFLIVSGFNDDGILCTGVKEIVIADPPPVFTVTTDITNVSCNGGSDGAIDLTVTSPNNGNFSYDWPTQGSNSQDISGLPAGDYEVKISQGSHCEVHTFTVTEPDPISLATVATNLVCNGEASGAVDLQVSGGTAPYTYLWDNGTTTEDLTGLTAGSYNVTVTDANGCTAITGLSITEPTVLAVNATQTDVLCNGDATGAIDITPSGGTLPYSYSWSNGQNSQDLNGLMAGTYTLTLTDGSGCTVEETITITQPNPIILTSSATNVDCNGSATGEIDLTAIGGTGALTYSWSNGATTEDITGLTAGTYSVTVTDINGCTASTSVSISQPAALVLSSTQINASCNGTADASIDLSVAGGVGGNSYLWSNGATTQDLSNITAGTYSVTVTDANGCTANASVTITEPTAIVINSSITNVACKNGTDGSIDVTVSGGAGGYTYSWDSGETSQDLSNLIAGTYTLTVTDATGCFASVSLNVTEPATNITASSAITNVPCNGTSTGSIDLTVANATGAVTYDWSNGATTEDLVNVPAGTYSVIITDQLGCFTLENLTITEPTALITTLVATNVDCFGASTGAINLVVSGGTAPYTYAWNNGETTEDISGLTAGLYSVVVTDANGCSNNEALVITEPTALNLSATETDASCNGLVDGVVDLTVLGGTAPYTYVWSNGVTTQDLTNVAAGAYSVTVTDANGCSANLNATINEPTAIVISETVTDAGCNGGTAGEIDITIAGGTAPFTYSWSNGESTEDLTNLGFGNYTVTVTDANNCSSATKTISVSEDSSIIITETVNDADCNGNSTGSITLNVNGGTPGYTYVWADAPGLNSPNRPNIPAGNYQVIITDAAGCSSARNYTVNEPPALTLATTQINVVCNGGTNGSINLFVNGGTPPYQFNWDSGVTNTQNRAGLGAGSYSVVVTDNFGCQATANVVITQPDAISFNPVITNVACNGESSGAIDLNVTGGTPGYTYIWSNGATTEDISNLTAGNYDVTVTDVNGCSSSTTFTVTEPLVLTANAIGTNITCNGNNDGSIDLAVNGGTAPYTYSWDNGAVSEDLSNLAPGTYNVDIVDFNGCTTSASVLITQPAVLTVSESMTHLLCNGDASGEINLTINGGTAPYTYSWSNGETTEDITGLIAGNYSVTVEDANGCQFNQTYTIAEPTALSLSITKLDVACNGDNTGFIDLTATGGTGLLSYSWNGGAFTSEDLNAIPAGTYTVVVTDGVGCTASTSVTITEPTAIAITSSVTDATCKGDTDGTVDISVSGGVAPYNILWNTGAITEDLNGVGAGTYTVLITDANGCTFNSGNIIVGEPPTTLTASFNSTNLTCNGSADGAIDLTVSGGVPPVTYSWTNIATSQEIATSQDVSGLAASTYSVRITDANGCIRLQNINITQPTVLGMTLSKTDIECNGDMNGSIDINVTGGTPPYTYNWSNGATSQDLSGLNGGTYSVIVTDANGCTTGSSTIINEPTALTLTNVTRNVSCNGGDDGDINLILNGGSPPFTYAWSNGATTQDLTSLSAGTYSVIVTDSRGCTNGTSITVTEPATNISASASVTDILCKGARTGAVDLTITGGTPPYNVQWDFGATTEDVTGLAAGSYSVTISDANSCLTLTGVTISEPAAELVATQSSVNVSCFGGNDGSINATVTGGTAPYTYSWSNGATTEDLSNLIAGNYTLTVTDDFGCTFDLNVTITQPDELTLSANNTNVSCFGGNDGSIDLGIVGGTAPYTVTWSNGSTLEDISNLSVGNYSVMVVDDNGCSAGMNVTITQPTPISITSTELEASCNGGADGEIDLTVTGGTAPYTYIWSNGATTEDITGLTLGNYTVNITDANGCTASQVITVNEESSFTLSATGSDASCNAGSDGSINLIVTGGTPPFNFNWSNGETTEDISNLTAGDYSVLVSDGTGCTSTLQFTIDEPDPIDVAVTQESITCNGDNDGQIALALTGGTPPYTVNVALNAGTDIQAFVTDNNGCPNATFGIRGLNVNDVNSANWNVLGNVITITDLPPGTFEIFRPDLGNTVIDTQVITEPAPLAQTAITQNISCNGGSDGSIALSVTGGNGNYTYSWSTGATTRTISNLASGTYTVQITDNKGCILNASYTLTEPTPLNASAGIVNALCFGTSTGNITTVVSGGTAPYTYTWSNGATTSNLNSIPAGNYQLQVTDANGCVITENYTVTQPPQLVATETISNLNCFEDGSGAIVLSVAGGTGNYTYEWSTGATSRDITGLSAGNYTVIITDQNGCSIIESYNISQPNLLVAGGAKLDISCFGANDGLIDLVVSGGTAPYNYSWSNGASVEDLNGLSAGNYSVNVTDANGCFASANFTIIEPAGVTVQVSTTDLLCNGANTGSIDLAISGGTPAYIVNWDNGARGPSLTGLAAGDYQATVVDGRGCPTTINVTITEPSPITIVENITNISCYGARDGEISVQVSGGQGPYTYLWSTGSTTNSVDQLDFGSYRLEVTDANNCKQVVNYTISQPSALQAQIVKNLIIDCENRTVTEEVRVVARGGTNPISYNWNNDGFGSEQSIIMDEDGSNVIVVRDANGCEVTLSATTVLPEQGEASFVIEDGTIDPYGNYTLNTPIKFTATFSSNITSYRWDLGNGETIDQESFEYTYTEVGNYTVTLSATDSNGCTIVTQLDLTVNLGYDIVMPTAFTPNGDNLNDRLYPEYYGVEDIRLVIFNNWGDVVFVSETIESGGWNGRLNDEDAPAGGYAYKLNATSISGKEIEKTGSFLLIKR